MQQIEGIADVAKITHWRPGKNSTEEAVTGDAEKHEREAAQGKRDHLVRTFVAHDTGKNCVTHAGRDRQPLARV